MEHRREGSVLLDEKELLRCCGSTKFAKDMSSASPFSSFDLAVSAARHIWFNLVDVNGWLEAFLAHPRIGQSPPAQWSKAEQSTALATSAESSLQELSNWNARYMLKFGIVFLICASGRTTAETLTELKVGDPIDRPQISDLEESDSSVAVSQSPGLGNIRVNQ